MHGFAFANTSPKSIPVHRHILCYTINRNEIATFQAFWITLPINPEHWPWWLGIMGIAVQNIWEGEGSRLPECAFLTICPEDAGVCEEWEERKCVDNKNSVWKETFEWKCVRRGSIDFSNLQLEHFNGTFQNMDVSVTWFYWLHTLFGRYYRF